MKDRKDENKNLLQKFNHGFKYFLLNLKQPARQNRIHDGAMTRMPREINLNITVTKLGWQ